MEGVQEGETPAEAQDQEGAQDAPDSDKDSDDEELPSHTFKEHKFIFKDFERVSQPRIGLRLVWLIA